MYYITCYITPTDKKNTIHSSIQVGGVCTYVIIMAFPNFGRCIMPFRFEEELVFLFFFFDGGVEVDV